MKKLRKPSVGRQTNKSSVCALYVAHAGLLPLPCEYWVYRLAPPCQAYFQCFAVIKML